MQASTPSRKCRVQISVGKNMVTIFLDAFGIQMVDFLEHGHTISASQWRLSCITSREAPHSDHSEKASEVEERCACAPGQCFGT